MDESYEIQEDDLPGAEKMTDEERDRLEREIMAQGLPDAGVQVLGREKADNTGV